MSASPELRASSVTLDFDTATPDDLAGGDRYGDQMVHVFQLDAERYPNRVHASFGGAFNTAAIAGRRETVRWLLTEALRQLDALETEDGGS